MGKIENMQNDQNVINLSYVRKKREEMQKPKLTIKGFNDLTTLIGPNAKKYRLNQNQKKFQLGGRITIAAIAAAIGIGTFGAIAHSHDPSIPSQTAIETLAENELIEDEVLKNAEETLLDIIYKNDIESKNLAYVEYNKINDVEGSYSLKVLQHFKNNPSVEPTEKFHYTYYDNSISKFISPSHNAKEIDKLLDLMVEINNEDNPSQKKLKNLNEICEKINSLGFNLQGNSIVAENQHDLEER